MSDKNISLGVGFSFILGVIILKLIDIVEVSWRLILLSSLVLIISHILSHKFGAKKHLKNK